MSDRDAWDYYLGKAKHTFEAGEFDRDHSFKNDLAHIISAARTALLAGNENWPQLLRDAIKDRRNILINWRDQDKLLQWLNEGDGVRQTLQYMWAEEAASPGDRIRRFDENLPSDLFGPRARSTRLDCGSYLMMGLDGNSYPPVRLTRFQNTYGRLGYPESGASDLGGEYEYALQFLDEVMAAAQKRGMERPATRLEAQYVAWWLSYQPAINGDYTDSLGGSSVDAHFESQGLNTILYGPPGTGKTYSTARRCVEICDGQVSRATEEMRARYGELMGEGRIEFVTFHQSYGYEEFVEGLRPVMSESGSMRLDVVDGVLKRMAERARRLPEVDARRIFKMTLGDPKSWGGTTKGDAVFAECIERGCVLLDRGGDIDWSESLYDDWREIWERWRRDNNPDATAYDTDIQSMWRFRTEMERGDIVVASDGYRHFRAVGEVSGDYKFQWRDDGFHHCRAVNWHWHADGGTGDSVSTFKEGRFDWRPIHHLQTDRLEGLIRYLRGIEDLVPARPHVLIIDEINRANISKVMGELITLLEEDKREGAENEIAVTLPHSEERFTLPSNLHILGTMNTADRSIALLDTALRRRFHFEEMCSRPDLLLDVAQRTGVDLPRVLRAMNDRLEYLVDRDHVIGHAWLMEALTREDVDIAMRWKIIPLIAEYFYDDWGKVRAVLGGTDHFVERELLEVPPGLDSDMGEDRYRWTVREVFAEDAYEILVDPTSRRDSGE